MDEPEGPVMESCCEIQGPGSKLGDSDPPQTRPPLDIHRCNSGRPGVVRFSPGFGRTRNFEEPTNCLENRRTVPVAQTLDFLFRCGIVTFIQKLLTWITGVRVCERPFWRLWVGLFLPRNVNAPNDQGNHRTAGRAHQRSC